MTAIERINQLRRKGYQIEARRNSVILFKPEPTRSVPDGGRAYHLMTVSTYGAVWQHEDQAKEFTQRIADELKAICND